MSPSNPPQQTASCQKLMNQCGELTLSLQCGFRRVDSLSQFTSSFLSFSDALLAFITLTECRIRCPLSYVRFSTLLQSVNNNNNNDNLIYKAPKALALEALAAGQL